MPKQKAPQKKSPSSLQQNKLFGNLRRTTEQLVQGRGYQPMSLKELMQRLKLPDQHLDMFKAVLDSHIEEGLLYLKQGEYTLKSKLQQMVTGTVRMHVRGFGFVKPDEPTSYVSDIFIPKHLTMNAIDGDRVEVVVHPEISEKGPEGKISAILTRAHTHVAGIIVSTKSSGEAEAYVPAFGLSRRVFVTNNPELSLKQGDRVVMKVIEWGSHDSDTICLPTHLIGHISDPSSDIPAAIEEYGLRVAFPSKALEEAKSFGTQVSRRDLLGREDIRHVECVTIDPDTAKDFDDAISLEKDSKGHYHLGVHIADVSHYVQEGSGLDIEAQQRCNSTYFPGYCLPMLPGILSENLCSLRPNVNRLTASIFIHFDSEGTLLDYRMARTVIRSSKRFTYRQAKAILDGKRRSKHAPLLHLMVELCQALKAKRYERGSIEFSLPDLIIKVDPEGLPFETEYVAYDVTHQMIEEFMLKANELVALHLSKEGKGVAYRVHDEPSEESMKEFSMLANAFGFDLKEKCSTKALQEFFDEALQTPYGPYLATSYIRCMRQALYSPENIGHYGLGLSHYCHFTSPIRRYVDLVVHRQLFGTSKGAINLDTITQACSEQERSSAKAENAVILLKKLRLLAKFQEENPHRQYEAVVTRVKQFGFGFEVLDFLIEGFFHVADLTSDYFIYEDKGRRLRGRHSNSSFCAGDRITVMLRETDFLRLESKWHLIGEATPAKKPIKKRTEKKSRSTPSQKKIEAPKKPSKKTIKHKKNAHFKEAP